jgi:SWIM zinc finger
MSTVADPLRAVGAPPPPVRHGIARLTLRIGGTDYRLRPMPAPTGFRAVWVLRKLDPHSAAVTYAVAQAKGEPAACTCPDHEINGAICKHVLALAAIGLIPKQKVPKPRQSRKRDLQLHARNAHRAIAEANALPAEARRHPAEIAPPPEDFAAGFRAAIRDELARMGGTPAEPRPALCELCGDPFDPAASRDPHYCTECLEGGAL